MSEYNKIFIIAAHNHSSKHRDEIINSESCRCFYCLSVFKPNEILDWVDDGDIKEHPEFNDSSALCPKCGIDDAVIGDLSGFPVTDMSAMQLYWF